MREGPEITSSRIEQWTPTQSIDDTILVLFGGGNLNLVFNCLIRPKEEEEEEETHWSAVCHYERIVPRSDHSTFMLSSSSAINIKTETFVSFTKKLKIYTKIINKKKLWTNFDIIDIDYTKNQNTWRLAINLSLLVFLFIDEKQIIETIIEKELKNFQQ